MSFTLLSASSLRVNWAVPSACVALSRLSSSQEYGFWNLSPSGAPEAVPPFVVQFSTTAMGGHALAAGDEEGIVTLLDTRENLRAQMHTPTHPRFFAHDNAIFDLVWLQDDRFLATASGDSTVRVFDVERSSRRALLRGHTGSVKCVRACPAAEHVLLSGSRDGDILGFDLRTPTVKDMWQDAHHAPVLRITKPHACLVRYGISQSNGRKRRRVQAECAGTKVGGVTSIAFSPSNYAHVFSGGATDGSVKQWDLRKLRTPCRTRSQGDDRPVSGVDEPVSEVVPGNELRRDDPNRMGRAYGVAHVDVDTQGRYLLVSYTNSSIYMYQASNILLGYDKVLTGHTQTSFYIRARFSPDGRYVISGSADSSAYIWDLYQPGLRGRLSPALELVGHRGGEASAVDWCKTDLLKVATCADDSTTKVWTLGPNASHPGDEPGILNAHARVPPIRHRPTRSGKIGCVTRSSHKRILREQDIRHFFEPLPRKNAIDKSPIMSFGTGGAGVSSEADSGTPSDEASD